MEDLYEQTVAVNKVTYFCNIVIGRLSACHLIMDHIWGRGKA